MARRQYCSCFLVSRSGAFAPAGAQPSGQVVLRLFRIFVATFLALGCRNRLFWNLRNDHKSCRWGQWQGQLSVVRRESVARLVDRGFRSPSCGPGLDDPGGQVHHRAVAVRQLVVPGGHGPELLDVAEVVLYQVAGPVRIGSYQCWTRRLTLGGMVATIPPEASASLMGSES